VDGEGGFTLPVGDTAAMSDRVVALLSDPRELATQRERARLRATGTFGTVQVVDRYEALYHRLLGH
jgi:glycosyltransferase involved in cell wall biosynthesis